jgi:CBS-domain-containing membrane protein
MRTHLVSLGESATFSEAVDILDLYQLPWVAVTDDAGVLMGVLLDSLVVKASKLSTEELSALGTRKVSDLIVSLPVVTPEDDAMLLTLPDDLLARWIPVVDIEQHLVGMLDRVTVAQAGLDLLASL